MFEAKVTNYISLTPPKARGKYVLHRKHEQKPFQQFGIETANE